MREGRWGGYWALHLGTADGLSLVRFVLCAYAYRDIVLPARCGESACSCERGLLKRAELGGEWVRLHGGGCCGLWKGCAVPCRAVLCCAVLCCVLLRH
jgi:hypothetical protein